MIICCGRFLLTLAWWGKKVCNLYNFFEFEISPDLDVLMQQNFEYKAVIHITPRVKLLIEIGSR